MILGIMKPIEKAFNAFGKFVSDNFDNPIFWAVLFLVMVCIAAYVIREIANK